MKKKVNKVQPVQCVWGLLCSLSSVDQERNNISLFNVIDEVNIRRDGFIKPGVKLLPLEHEIITLWRRTMSNVIDDREVSIDIEIALIDPQEKVIQQIITPLKLRSGARRTRFRLMVNGFSYTTPGDYVYRISIVPDNGEGVHIVFQIPFEIKEK